MERFKYKSYLYDTMVLSVRDVDNDVFRDFKAEAVKRGLKVGKALNFAMQDWLDKSSPRKSFMRLKPFHWGKGTENSSQEIDKILYS